MISKTFNLHNVQKHIINNRQQTIVPFNMQNIFGALTVRIKRKGIAQCFGFKLL